MLELDISLGAVAGAIANGSASDRWFIDIKNERLFMVSANFQSDEELEKAVDMINADLDNYLPLPFLGYEEFIHEVGAYIGTLSDAPSLAKHLHKAVDEKWTRDQVMGLLNRDPGKKKDFADFYSQRVQDKVAAWIDSKNIKLKS